MVMYVLYLSLYMPVYSRYIRNTIPSHIYVYVPTHVKVTQCMHIHVSACTFMQKTTTATRGASEKISRVCTADISGDELPGEQEVHTQRPGGQEHTNGRRGHL